MSGFHFGELIEVEIPFTDETGSKRRPAIVVSSARYNRERPELLVMPVTSRLKHRDTYGTLVIEDWERAGLRKPSVVKPLLWPVLKARVLGKIGILARPDKDALRATLAEILSADI